MAFAWLHKKLECPNPVDDTLVSQTLAGFKRLLAGPSKKKQPIESHHVRALIVPMVTLVLLYRTYKWCRWLRLAFVPSYVGQSCVTYVPVT